jgi:predicted small secreted protein
VKRLFLLLVVMLSLTACNGLTDGIGSGIGPAVFGVAYDAATNAPLDGVRVKVGDRSGLSGQTGSYYIGEVSKGVHPLEATKEGYAPFTGEVTVNESMVEKKLYLTKQ